MGVPDIEGPIPVPGAGGAQLTDALGVPQGWGAVPGSANLTCVRTAASGVGRFSSDGVGLLAAAMAVAVTTALLG
jgi:hypothetical protein